MTQLKVRPIDPKAPGSWKKRQRLIHASTDMKKAVAAGDDVATVEALEVVEALIVSSLYTLDGSPVDDALEELSIEEWESLSAAYGGAEPVPTTSSEL